MTTSTFAVEYNKLKNIEKGINKSVNVFLNHFNAYDNCLLELENEINLLRQNDTEKLQTQVQNVQIFLKNIRKLLYGKEIHEIDVNNFKQDMIAIQDNIDSLKKTIASSMSKLKQEEFHLQGDIEKYENQIEEWTNPVTIKPIVRRTSAGDNRELYQEAKDFLNFVSKSGGHENGWASEDHLQFLKIKSAASSAEELSGSLHKLLPDITEEEIINHNKWHEKYVELKEKQKKALKNWKLSKESVKTKAKVTCLSAPPCKLKSQIPPRNLKEQLAVWKLQKEEERKKQIEIDKQAELRRKTLDERKRRKNEEIKEIIKEWRALKLTKEETEKFEAEVARMQQKKFKSMQAKRMIKQFQSQDNFYVQRKREILRAKTRSAEAIVPKKVVPRDPDRLLKPTIQWISRTDKKKGEKIEEINQQQKIEKLGVPEWRKGIF